MSFWSDASPIVKGAVILFALGVVYLGTAYAIKIAPFVEEETTAVRGIQ